VIKLFQYKPTDLNIRQRIDMTVNIKFICKLEVNELNKNYTGEIILKGSDSSRDKKMYFLCINPHDPSTVELAFYKDSKKTEPIYEAVGFDSGTLRTHPSTGLPIVALESITIESPKVENAGIGLAYVASSIISEAIYNSEKDLEASPKLLRSGKRPVFEFQHEWQQTFGKSTQEIAQGLVQSLNL